LGLLERNAEVTAGSLIKNLSKENKGRGWKHEGTILTSKPVIPEKLTETKSF